MTPEDIKREGDNNTIAMGSAANNIGYIATSRVVHAITRYRVPEAYVVPADVLQELIDAYKR